MKLKPWEIILLVVGCALALIFFIWQMRGESFLDIILSILKR